MNLSECIQRAMFFGNDISFKKDDITGSGFLLVLENKESKITEQVLLPLDHITDEKFIKYINLISATIYNKSNLPKDDNQETT